MKHLIGVLVLVALALAFRFWLSSNLSIDFYIHAKYFHVLPIRIIVFWLLMGVAAVWIAIAAYKFGRHSS
jgi:hypothetical protein